MLILLLLLGSMTLMMKLRKSKIHVMLPASSSKGKSLEWGSHKYCSQEGFNQEVREWCNGQHCCLPSSRSGFDSRLTHIFFFPFFSLLWYTFFFSACVFFFFLPSYHFFVYFIGDWRERGEDCWAVSERYICTYTYFTYIRNHAITFRHPFIARVYTGFLLEEKLTVASFGAWRH